MTVARQSVAKKTVKNIVGNDGGGALIIHRPNGEIRDKDTMAPGRDPHPPKDTTH